MPVTTTTLANVLESSPFRDAQVDLLDVDCELQDLAVLRGFPFDKCRPVLIAVEAHTSGELAEISGFLENSDYFKVATRGPSHIFRSRDSVPQDIPATARLSELQY